MSWITSLQKAIDYIEEHLLDELDIATISKQANSSMYHFQRTFSLLTDIPVGEYIRRRRLTLAAKELASTNSKVIDVAYKYGYDSPESFTKAFRKQHGITPRQARNHSGRLKSYNRLVIQVTLKGAEPMQYKIVEKDSFQVTGRKESFSVENDENYIGIPKMWDRMNTDGTVEKLVNINTGQLKGLLGVCVDSSNEQSKQIDYWIAVAHSGDKHDDFDILNVPASKWAVFEAHGPMPHAIQDVWKKIMSEWFPSSGYEHAGTPELEVYPEGDITSSDYYSEVWIPIK
ncbi:AraC family transcriptional regulator [Bacillus solimangrovi]|uniref:AraC family transcriptional regulator n=1 Tax=Bacillus solimangrovi TaxID=1305675 RepID=A0A1E5LJP3_9BACI|nr:AraC family transcriptional regulator [Bacillus solimangrovi]OEH94238.1 AraC family transcriptional regulator [Bacillus solimangrovi]